MKKLTDIEWQQVTSSLHERGFASIPSLLSVNECADMISTYNEEALFRSTVNMQRYRFGIGEYKYFAYPLPATIETIRDEFYRKLAPVANDWMQRLGVDIEYPGDQK